MLKLKDIFNIDISSKGGGKLYKKIMRKYNIPLKDTKEVKQEIVECSSGGGEDVFQYFKIINTDPLALGIISGICKVVEIIYFYHDSYIKVNRTDGYNTVDVPLTESLDQSIAFKVICGDFSATTIEGHAVYKGNTIKDRLLYVIEISGNPEESSKILQAFDSAFKEITKEEYEAMITYKP